MSDGDSCRLKYFEGEPEVLAEVRQMWDEIFDDPEEFADYYFTEICKQNKILLAYKGDVLATTRKRLIQIQRSHTQTL